MKKLILVMMIFTSLNFALANDFALSSTNQLSGLYYKVTQPELLESKGTVILTHGILENSGRYERFAHELNNAGFAVLGYDLRGHGKSFGRRAHISDFNSYVKDLGRIVNHVKKHNEEKPIFLFGHSMGGLITFLYTQQLEDEDLIKAVILSAPGLNIPMTKMQKAKLAIAKELRKFFPHMMAKEEINRAKLTDDLEMIKNHREDKSLLEDFTISLGVELAVAAQEAKQIIDNEILNLPPVLFIQGEADTVVDAKLNIESASKITHENNILVIKDGLHEILNLKPEVRQQVMADAINFLNSNL